MPTSRLIDALGDGFLRSELASQVAHGHLRLSDLQQIANWEDLNRALVSHRLAPPRVRLHIRAGEAARDDDYTTSRATRRDETVRTLDLDKVVQSLRDGQSLVIDAVDEMLEGVRNAAADLEWAVREPVQANAYLTWGNTSGFGPHWDDHDVIIVQVDGTKHWKVFGPTRSKPMYADVEHDTSHPESVIWEGVLTAGEVLHIPRGFWHDVKGAGVGSFHLTFGFTRRTNIDAILHTVESLRSHESLRSDIDRFGQDTSSFDEAITTAVAALRACEPAEALATRDAELAPRRALSLPFEIDGSLPEGPYTLEAMSRIPFKLDDNSKSCSISFGGQNITLPPQCRSALVALQRERSLTSDELLQMSALERNDFEKLVRTLVRWRIVAVSAR